MSENPTTRLIIKNIPPFFNEKDLAKEFEKKGQITDCKVMRTKEGKSRKFAFIGYKTIEEAIEAKKYFNNTFLISSKIIVNFAKPIGDETLENCYARKKNNNNNFNKEKNIENNLSSEEEKNEIDPEYVEYRNAVENHDIRQTWTDGILVTNEESKKKKKKILK